MGSSGRGKLTIGGLLALRLRWEFNYSDWFHPNVEKMHNGIPRTDEDRGPWLEAIAPFWRGTALSLAPAEAPVPRCSNWQLRGGSPSLSQGRRTPDRSPA